MRYTVQWILLAAWALGAGLADAQPTEPADCPAEPVDAEAAECYLASAKLPGNKHKVAAQIRSRLKDRPDLPWLWQPLGYLSFSCTGESEQAYRRAVELFAEAGETAHSINSKSSLSWNLARCGNVTSAEEELRQAEDLLGTIEYDALLPMQLELVRARVRMAQGGDLEAVYERLVQLEENLFKSIYDENTKIDGLRLESLRALGTLAYYLARYEEAQAWFERRFALSRANNDPLKLSSAQFDIDLVGAVLGSWRNESALQQARQRLQSILTDGSADKGIAAKVHLQLARWSLEDDARGHLTQCIELAQEQRDFRQVRRCRLALARVAVDRDPAAARDLLRQVHSDDAQRVDRDPWLRVDSWRDQLYVLWHTSPEPVLWEKAEDILSTIENLRRRQTGMARPDILHARSDVFYWLAGRLLSQEPQNEDSLRRAFALLERLRAQDLTETLSATDPPAVPHSSPHLLDRIAAELGDREAMVSFQIADDTDTFGNQVGDSWVWISTRQGTQVLRLHLNRRAIEAKLEMLRSSHWQTEDLADDLELLYQYLLAPAIDQLPMDIDRLVIIPDGVLHLLPFAALGPVEGPPLSARYETAIAPSATLWLHWRQAAVRAGPSAVLAFADPQDSNLQSASLRVTRTSSTGGAPQPLHHARQEGKRVVKLVGGDSRLFEGMTASESLLRRTDLRSVDILHFATHAFADTEYPQFSRVLLAAGDGEDGWLQPKEIAQLKLDGKVVVLSTCDSAAGAWRRGEGVISLARAFFEAGAHAVVGTLRPLPDDAAARFFDSFYQHLRDGLSLRSALAATQRQWIAAGEPASQWGSIVVLGHGDWKLNRSLSPSFVQFLSTPIFFGIATALLIGLFVIGYRPISQHFRIE